MKMIVALGTALASGLLLALSDGMVKAAWGGLQLGEDVGDVGLVEG